MEKLIEEMKKNICWNLIDYGSELVNEQVAVDDEIFLDEGDEPKKVVGDEIFLDKGSGPKSVVNDVIFLDDEDESESVDHELSSTIEEIQITEEEIEEIEKVEITPHHLERVSVLEDVEPKQEEVLPESKTSPDTSTECCESDGVNPEMLKMTGFSKTTLKLKKTHDPIKSKTTDTQSRSLLRKEPKEYQSDTPDGNIFSNPVNGYEYQMYFDGQAISESDFERIFRGKVKRTKSGYLICQIHRACKFMKHSPRRDPSVFNQGLSQHLGKDLITYLCRCCFRRFDDYEVLCDHLRMHWGHSELIKESKNDKKGAIKFRTRRTRPIPPSMDHQGKYELQLNDRNIYTQPETGNEYQIFYKGRAISEEYLNLILMKKIRKTENGWLVCSIHNNCPYIERRSKWKEKYQDEFNKRSLNHLRSALVTYFCRRCHHVTCHFSILSGHLKTHHEQLDGLSDQ